MPNHKQRKLKTHRCQLTTSLFAVPSLSESQKTLFLRPSTQFTRKNLSPTPIRLIIADTRKSTPCPH